MKTGYCSSVEASESVFSAKVKWELYKSERRSKSVGFSIHNDSFLAKKVANKCLHWGVDIENMNINISSGGRRKENYTNHDVGFRQKNSVYEGRTGAGIWYLGGCIQVKKNCVRRC